MVFMFFAGFLVFFYIRTFYMFSNLSGVLDKETGLFYSINSNVKAMSGGAFIVCLQNFLGIMVLLFSLHYQWQVESKYSMTKELICITIVWFISNQNLEVTQIIGINWMNIDDYPKASSFLSLDGCKLWNYINYTTRSIVCICITSIPTLYYSYRE